MTDAPSNELDLLLASARRARQQGDSAGARALLRALLAQYPSEPRAWLLLATVAQSRAEQQQAFEQVSALDPTNSIAQRGLAAMRQARAVALTPPVAPQPVERAAVTLQAEAPPIAEADQARSIRWPLYALIGTLLVICLIAGGLILRPQPQPAVTPLEPVGAVVASPQATSGAQIVASIAAAPTAAAPTSVATVPAMSTSEPALAEPTLSAPTSQPAQPTQPVSFGQIASAGVWNVGLLRPQDAVLLSGSIGNLQPQGRFVLALVAVSNSSNGERQLPNNLLSLVDASGQRYTPLPTASTAYLQAYGSNQAGIVSMESLIPANLGVVSVPVIFDVPINAHGFTLVVGTANTGWSIGG